MPDLDAERLARLAEETHYKPAGLASEYVCAEIVKSLDGEPGLALWGGTGLNLCWIEQPRMLRWVDIAVTEDEVEFPGGKVTHRYEVPGFGKVRADALARRITPLFPLETRPVATPFEETNCRFPTFAAEEVIAQVVVDLIRDGGILRAHDLSSARQVAFDVEATRRCLLVYLLAHRIEPDPGKVKERLASLIDADIDRDLAPLLSDRVPMVMEVQFRAWNMAAIFFEFRGPEVEFMMAAKAGKADPALLFPGRPDLIAHPLTRRAIEAGPRVL